MFLSGYSGETIFLEPMMPEAYPAAFGLPFRLWRERGRVHFRGRAGCDGCRRDAVSTGPAGRFTDSGAMVFLVIHTAGDTRNFQSNGSCFGRYFRIREVDLRVSL